MTLPLQLSSAFIAAALFGVAMTWYIRRVALQQGIVDAPDQERKIHEKPIPLMGGVALYITVSLVALVLYGLGWLPLDGVSGGVAVGVLVAGAVLVFGGIIDDRYSLSWWKQLLMPIVAVAIMLGSGLEISFITNPLGPGVLHLNEWQIPVATIGSMMFYFVPVADVILIIWILGMIYTTKLLDGVDGLASSISFVATIVLFVVSMTWDSSGSATSFIAMVFAGAIAGFLIWNWHPARIFLGEGGSTYIGFMLAVIAVLTGAKIAAALLVMGIPILDVLWIIIRRVRAKRKIYTGDSRHLHFRLLHAGLSQRKVVLLLSFLSLLFGSVSFFFNTYGKIVALVGLVIVMVIISEIYLKKHEQSVSHTD